MALFVDFLTPVIDWLVGLMTVIGAPGAGLAVAAENIFPPIPSELILPMAGFTASRGRFGVLEAIVWTTIGSTVGALALYEIGRRLGVDRLRRLAEKAPLMKTTDIDKTVRWFARHGGKAVLFGRMLPLFRSLISIPAGVERMPVWLFTVYTAVGSAIWNSVLVLAGYGLGANWHVVEGYIGVLQNVVLAVLVAASAYFVVHRLRQRPAAGESHPEHSRHPGHSRHPEQNG